MDPNSYFEDAPENVEISLHAIEIEQGDFLEPIICTADSSPEPSFMWKYNVEVISEEGVLVLADPLSK